MYAESDQAAGDQPWLFIIRRAGENTGDEKTGGGICCCRPVRVRARQNSLKGNNHQNRYNEAGQPVFFACHIIAATAPHHDQPGNEPDKADRAEYSHLVDDKGREVFEIE
ncbi:MAG: Uncharacterised protein [Hyphomonas sp. TMED17]|nr:MAG: Uncharacterised protein [Hyphomonas sp. TMED17]